MHDWERPAPGDLSRVQALVNTLDLERFGEHAGKPDAEREGLRSPQRLKAWFVGRGLLGSEDTVSEADRQLAIQVRDALRSAASVNSSPARERSEVVGLSFGQLPLVVRFGEASKPELVSGEGG